MNSLQFKDLLINFTTEFHLLWNDKGSGAHMSASFWRPETSANHLNNYFSLGDIAVEGYSQINNRRIIAVVSDANAVNGTALRPPERLAAVWNNKGSKGAAEISVWRPIPPAGYVAMGNVCSVGYDSPPLTTIRCVRADLVIASHLAEVIWSDKGSGALMDFSAWDIVPPEAQPGEAYLSPGTFFGVGGYARLQTPGLVHSLRVELPLLMSDMPPPPAPRPDAEPTETPADATVHCCELPWFAVRDWELKPTEQLKLSPTYRLERSDQYQQVGVGVNAADTNQTYNWRTAKGEIGNESLTLSLSTGIVLAHAWSMRSHLAKSHFSARFNSELVHTGKSSKGWSQTAFADIAAYIPANKTVAAYVIRSEYKLLRADGSQLATTVSYVNAEQVHFRESLPAEATTDNELASLLPALEPVTQDELPVQVPEVDAALEIAPSDISDDSLFL